jgi:alpha-galactosidase
MHEHAATNYLLELPCGDAELWVLASPAGPPCWVHIGARLGTSPSMASVTPPRSGTVLDDALVPLLPDPALGWTGIPGWSGADARQAWRFTEVRPEPGALIFAFVHEGGHRAELAVRALEDALFALDLEAFPASSASLAADRIAYTVPLPSSAVEGLGFRGRWAGELVTERAPLSGGWHRTSRAGSRTAHDAFPGFLAGEAGFGEDHGEVLAMHLGWFGNYDLVVARTRTGRFVAHVLLDVRELTPGPDGSRRAPTLYLGWSNEGMNGIRCRFQDGARRMRDASGATAPGKVQLNTWEGIYFDHDVPRLEAMVDAAAALGMERVVLDDGWFGRRRNDSSGLGDWTPRPEVYPDGLGPIIDRVIGAGMEFGLWVEPEMVNADSALFETHPDWILGSPDQPLGRNQYALDLNEPACFAHLERVLHALVADQRIASLKWDMNRDVPQAAGQPLVPVVRRLIDSVRSARGDLEIEACASGGGRADWSALAWCNRVWLSDAHDPDIRLPMMAAYGLFAPPEVMGSHIGGETSHQTGRRWSLRARAAMAVLGSMGVELDPLVLDDQAIAAIREHVSLHQRHRPWMRTGHLLVLPHPDPGLIAVGVFAAERNRALICLLQRDPRADDVPPPLTIRHLRGRLTVQAALLDRAIEHAAHTQPSWLHEPLTVDAELLAGYGLTLPVLPPQRGLLIEVLPAGLTGSNPPRL